MASLLKRLIDVVVAVAGLVVLAPVLVALALAIRLTMGPPVLFLQPRPGLNGRRFVLVKFRTMRFQPGSDAERLTPLGRWLRRTSLDELPQLWNVVRGDMSLVGPRPLLMDYLPHYSAQQARRHDLRPGITGWAQVNGRNALCWEDKFKYDVWYVDHWSIVLDFRILFRTAREVLRSEGIDAPDQGAVAPFRGPSGECS